MKRRKAGIKKGGRVMDCRVKGPWVQIPSLFLTSRTETNSLSQVVTDEGGKMLCTVKLVKKDSHGGVFDMAVEQLELFRKLH